MLFLCWLSRAAGLKNLTEFDDSLSQRMSCWNLVSAYVHVHTHADVIIYTLTVCIYMYIGYIVCGGLVALW